MAIDGTFLPLERAYHWERTTPTDVYMTQPVGGGRLETFSWKETVDQARRMAAHIHAQGFEPGSSIAIVSKNCAWLIITDLAIWMAGHRSVVLYPTLDAKTARFILDHSDARLLFVGKLDDWDEIAKGVPEELPGIAYPLSPPTDYPRWSDIISDTAPIDGSPTRKPEETSMLIYTSGSTGTPKGVEIAFGTMGMAIRGANDLLGLSTRDRMLSYLPLAHAYERVTVESGSLCQGYQVFFAESLDTFLADLQRARPTIFQSVPRLWLKFQLGVFAKIPRERLALLLKVPVLRGFVRQKVLRGLGLDAVRYALTGSAPTPPELVQWYRDLGLELLEAYGMSENFCYSHISMPGKSRVGYVGSPWPGVECKLTDEGEILIRTEANMKGYFRMPEATAQVLTEDGWLHTGDLGEQDEQGRLKITGRVKELFKTSKGKYIAPAPIENLLNADPRVEQCCVAGLGYPQPHALVLLAEEIHGDVIDPAVREDLTQTLKELLRRVNAQLEHHERLRFLAVVKDRWQIENGFLTPTLKIRRSVLETTYGPLLDGWYEQRDEVVWQL